ncbi:MAG TPA: SAM-dependent methyltransferase [Opitutae bacterium]|nr:SAM-dependent methyltransferase [Opitutae bacterium]|tara:strand:+ start:20720 stop:21988 length:1269 start_codon:yes stop_codon:yes gene_type:complete
MSKQVTEPSSGLAVANDRRKGFFENLLLSGLGNITHGALRVETDSGSLLLGQENDEEMRAEIRVADPVFFRKACLGGSLGVADSYASGDWSTPDLVMLFRLFLRNLEVMDGLEGGWATLLNKVARWGYSIGQRNTINGSRRNIALHYDLGNEFYELMLDPTMTYSCGIFETPEATLEEASLAKYDRIIDLLEVKSGHHLLEIGCGWGGFAHRLAERTDARLTATTISESQYQYALERIRKNGCEDRISIVKQDYRNLAGQFDRIVSIEMIEAVGHEYLPSYFSKISDLLAPDGAALIQGITMPDHRYEQYLKEVDYIRTRVFPGSCVPSASAMIAAAVKRSDLRPAALHDFGYHYSRTLREWRVRFKENEEKIDALGYDDSFRRAWEYYLCYCEAGFEEGYTGDVHLLLAKPACKMARGFPQ